MTRYENKEYNYLKIRYERDIEKKLWHKDGNLEHDISSFCMDAMDLLEEYHIKDIQYRERIKTLKEMLKRFSNLLDYQQDKTWDEIWFKKCCQLKKENEILQEKLNIALKNNADKTLLELENKSLKQVFDRIKEYISKHLKIRRKGYNLDYTNNSKVLIPIKGIINEVEKNV